jgi:deoxyribodipyrimidine photo-lyase
MWCLGLWDRPWGNKPIWGGIRPMVTSRAKLKFDVAGYIRRVGSHSAFPSDPRPGTLL